MGTRIAGALCALLSLGAVLANPVVDDPRIVLRRGDANNDGVVNIADPTVINRFLFQGGAAPTCMNQADANNDGRVDVSDSVFLFSFLFGGGSAPAYPGPVNTQCALDDEPYPGCEVDPCS
jgi:hypothetical protein